MPFKNALYTKIRAKERGRLKLKDYNAIIALKTVPDIAAYLKYNTRYAVALKDINEQYIHRGQLEVILRSTIADDINSLARFEQGKTGKFIRKFPNRQSANHLKKSYLNKTDYKIATQILGSETDLTNIRSILRLKKYYNQGAQEIYPYIISNKHKLSHSRMVQMAEASDFESAAAIVQSTVYGKAINLDTPFLEHDINIYINKIYKKLYRENPNSIAAVLHFIHRKEIEVNNIIEIIEGIRYHLDADDIKAQLIGIN